jgi:hypothetical protein
MDRETYRDMRKRKNYDRPTVEGMASRLLSAKSL